MLRRKVRNDLQPRSRSGHPHQRIAGVARAICTQFQYGAMAENQAASGPVNISTIETATNGNARTTLTQKRRLIIRSSAFSSGPGSDVNIRGSRAIPQIGHAPGLSLTTSGSIGQMYSTFPELSPGPWLGPCVDAGDGW